MFLNVDIQVICTKLAYLDDIEIGYMAYNVDDFDIAKLIRHRQTGRQGKYLSLVRLFQLLLTLGL
jgi:hypothetical protein